MVAWGAKDSTGAICYTLHAGQSKVLRSNKRFTVACAGTGGGKTVTGPLWVITQIQRVLADVKAGRRDLQREPILGMIVAPTHPIMARATAPTFVSMLAGTDLEGKYVPSQNRYYLPLGSKRPGCESVVWLLSADNPGSIEGGQFDFVWGDEFGQARYAAHVAIEGRTGKRQAPVLYTTTPYGMNWLYHKMYKEWKNGDKNTEFIQWSSITNPAYPREEYNRAKAGMSDERGQQRYDGLFVRMAGLVYPSFERCLRPAFRIDPEQGLRAYGGLDWGWNDPFVSLVAALDDEDVLWVWYERYKRHTMIRSHANAIPRDVTYYADPSRPDYIREMRIAGHTVIPASNDIQIGIDAVNARILTNRLRVSRACIGAIGESEEYRYPEDEDEIRGEKPIDKFNHAMDTLRYLVMGVDKNRLSPNERWNAEQEAEEAEARIRSLEMSGVAISESNGTEELGEVEVINADKA